MSFRPAAGIIVLLGASASWLSEASAQSGRPEEHQRSVQTRVDEWLKTCLGDWDVRTHMTKGEWRATCVRVASERGKVLLQTPPSDSIPKARRKVE